MWRHATRAEPEQTMRRCGAVSHEGERWMPLTVEHFFQRRDGGFDYWCKQCRRVYARERWREANPRRGSERRHVDAFATLDTLTSAWGRR